MTWSGLHPRRYRWGYAVVAVTIVDGGAVRIVDSRHAWTLSGAANMADRLNREEHQRAAAMAEADRPRGQVSGSPPAPRSWSVRRVVDHPDR
jgi:hypothetical protein